MLPVPEEVRNMHEKIDRIVETLHRQSQVMERLAERIGALKSYEQKIAEMGRELTEIRNTLAVIKDCVRFDRVA
jgi:predicted nucleic-acid-binding protein